MYFFKLEVEYLGFTLTRQGVLPQSKKVESILEIKPPTTVKAVKSWVGLINFYRMFWKCRAHHLYNITNLTKRVGILSGLRNTMSLSGILRI